MSVAHRTISVRWATAVCSKCVRIDPLRSRQALPKGVELMTAESGVEHAFPAFDSEMFSLGREMASALLDQPGWRHRLVDTLSLLDGERARRRLSIDCTPPNVRMPSRPHSGVTTELQLLHVAHLSKAPVRSLDIVDANGDTLPVLTRTQNTRVAAAVVGALVEEFGEINVTNDPELWRGILLIVGGPVGLAREQFEQWIVPLKLDPIAENAIKDLVGSFLLVAVIPPSAVGVRSVFKYSYHWQGWDRSSSLTKRPAERLRQGYDIALAGFGLGSSRSWAESVSLGTVESYHFECDAPAGLMLSRTALPADASGARPEDLGPQSVGHVNGSYELVIVKDQRVQIDFEIDRRNSLSRVLIASLAVLLGSCALLVNPLLLPALLANASISTSLFLALAATFLGWLARPAENRLVSSIHRSLRWSSALLSGLVIGYLVIFTLGATPVIASWGALVAVFVSALIFAPSLIGWLRVNVSIWR